MLGFAKRILRLQWPEGVDLTAGVVARARAIESRRSDRLFHDPCAKRFATAAKLNRMGKVRDIASDYFVLRTRFFDDYLLDACAAGCRQVVILAAGLDARAFRLAWGEGVNLFEVDLPGLLSFKERVLAATTARPLCRRVVVPVDLCGAWPAALYSAGFRVEQPTAWLAEGLLMYLTAECNDRLLARIATLSAPGSRLAMEHLNRAYLELSHMRPVHEWLDAVGSPWKSHLDDPCQWLAGHGWRAEVFRPAQVATRYGRPVPGVVRPCLNGAAQCWLVTAMR
jgi:methyltransferase (TIGR00027 family)